MDQTAGKELPPAVHDGPFSYGSKGFVVTPAPDVERLATGRLTELLRPETVLDTWIREKTKKEARHLMTTPWVIAHLEFYEIAYEPKHTFVPKKHTLKVAVERGMCHELPRKILEKALRLAERYSRSALRLLQERADSFSTASSATIELNVDEDRFLQKYFLGQDGKPDRTKTPEPIVLVGLNDPMVTLEIKSDEILYRGIALRGSRNILVLGWSKERVLNVISILESRQGDDRYSAEQNLTPQDLARHQDILSTSLDSRISLPRGAVGHYTVRSTEIKAQAQVEIMSLAVMKTNRDGWIAAFNFDVFGGFMILDTSVSRLNARWVKSKTSNCRVMEWESDSGVDHSDSEDELTVAAQKQVSVNENPSKSRLRATPARKQKRSLTSDSEKPPKRRKLCEKDHARLLFFRWYTVSQKGDVQVGVNETQRGRLEFLDGGCTKFEGTLSGSSLGHKVSFQGFKVDRENEQHDTSCTGNTSDEAEDN